MLCTDVLIQKYFDQNKDSFKEIYKSVNFLKLVPKNLTGINLAKNFWDEAEKLK